MDLLLADFNIRRLIVDVIMNEFLLKLVQYLSSHHTDLLHDSSFFSPPPLRGQGASFALASSSRNAAFSAFSVSAFNLPEGPSLGGLMGFGQLVARADPTAKGLSSSAGAGEHSHSLGRSSPAQKHHL